MLTKFETESQIRSFRPAGPGVPARLYPTGRKMRVVSSNPADPAAGAGLYLPNDWMTPA